VSDKTADLPRFVRLRACPSILHKVRHTACNVCACKLDVATTLFRDWRSHSLSTKVGIRLILIRGNCRTRGSDGWAGFPSLRLKLHLLARHEQLALQPPIFLQDGTQPMPHDPDLVWLRRRFRLCCRQHGRRAHSSFPDWRRQSALYWRIPFTTMSRSFQRTWPLSAQAAITVPAWVQIVRHDGIWIGKST
jgi:hypothetical protein